MKMKNRFIIILIMILLLLPFITEAKELSNVDDDKLLIETTKYYKTTNNYAFYKKELTVENSNTIEITKDEYDSFNVQNSKATTVETTYKKLTSSISKNGNFYRYKAKLTWKNIPSVRSYDIIGIGFYQSVKIKNNNVFFAQNYCLNDGSCYNSSINYPQLFSSGAGTSFLLPKGSLSSLSQTFYFDVEKNTTSTITAQLVASDYSHATSSISLKNSKKYSVSSNGIVLNGVSSYYDSINASKTYWSGNW